MIYLIRIICVVLLWLVSDAVAGSTVSVSLDTLDGPNVHATKVTTEYRLDKRANAMQITAETLQVADQHWRKPTLVCASMLITQTGVMECSSGMMQDSRGQIPIAFSLDLSQKRLQLILKPDQNEIWQVDAQSKNGFWKAAATLQNAKLMRAQSLMTSKKDALAINAGLVNGHVIALGDGNGISTVNADIKLSGLAFANADGSHAGEKVDLKMTFSVTKQSIGFAWQFQGNWQGGEIFWQPVYVSDGGIAMTANGHMDDHALSIEHANLQYDQIGNVNFSAAISLPDQQLQTLNLDAQGLHLSQAYLKVLKPILGQSLLGDLELAGRADIQCTFKQGALAAFDMRLNEVDIADKKNRFAFYKVNAHVPWTLTQATEAKVQYQSAQLLAMSLGSASLQAKLDGYSLLASQWNIPILDGALTLNDVSAAYLNQQWYGHLSANISPISMPEFSHAVGWPSMEGQVAAKIPLLTLNAGSLTMDGDMEFKVFDGSMRVSQLNMHDVFGLAPQLQAHIAMRSLDLGLLTRTFSFGAMSGRVDGDVNGLLLSKWQPVKFDAKVQSSEGSYPKKISQRAVENISALGGAGAAAAIQRSFLRFFKEFNYAKIGLSCRLENGICKMDGVESAQSGYVIVKGSGIPSITVMGYNQTVGWDELLGRLKRVIQGNTQAVIQ